MYEQIPKLIENAETICHIGKIEHIVGMSMEASGGKCAVGDIAMIYSNEQNRQVPAEVVGFKDGRVQLMAYESTGGIESGSFVRNTHHLRRDLTGLLVVGIMATQHHYFPPEASMDIPTICSIFPIWQMVSAFSISFGICSYINV